jgi:unsaturated rhamnogalacturonyl hydrolase
MNHIDAKVDCAKLAGLVFERHLATKPLEHYAGILSLHGALRLAGATDDSALLEKTRALLKPFYGGEVTKVCGVYTKMYCSGGYASAWLALAHGDEEAKKSVVAHAEELMASHPRNADGVFGTLKDPEKIWIDSVYAVCPYLVYVGRMTGRDEFHDEACKQLLGMDAKLRDRATGLYFQSLNFAGPGKLSGDHWSRGNGWAAIGLAEMSCEMPDSHPRKAEVKKLFAQHMESCLRFQDADGMWHQDMTDHSSYVETSGTGLILYSLGRGLEKGLLPESMKAAFQKGLRGCLRYVAFDGSVFNTCIGCLCPGDGSAEAYKARPWALNDDHAFGPVILAFSQAVKLGIREISL